MKNKDVKYLQKVPWSGERTSFRAYRDVTRRDQLTTGCSCQTIHRCNHRHRTSGNGHHQLRTGLKRFSARIFISSYLKRRYSFFCDKRNNFCRKNLRLISPCTSSFRSCPAEKTFPGTDVNTIERRLLSLSFFLISRDSVFNISNDRELREAGSLNRMILTYGAKDNEADKFSDKYRV